ncbi:MAG: alanine racemase [candidate division NC10 bacterium]|nr:alanine racemase [candidate division NC10 bacterium]
MKDWEKQPTYAVVDLRAVASNVRGIKARVGRSVKVMAVVKADAYGHGAVEVSKAALKVGAEWLGVAIPEEGIELRRAGIDSPILVLGPTLPSQAALIVDFDLDQVLSGLPLAEALSSFACRRGKTVGVHLKIDTGMGRLGIFPAEAVAFARKVHSFPGLTLRGLMTHLATAGEDNLYARKQVKAFQEVAEALKQAEFAFPFRHVANSAAVLDLPESFFDMVRPGLILYGCYPSKTVSRPFPLRPALSLRTRIASLKEVPKGAGISYGRTFIAGHPMKVAILPLGYADGLSFLLSNRGEALIRGRKARIVGRVCMDMTLVEVTTIPGVKVGDEVVIYGQQGKEAISVEAVAARIGTIAYELLCSIGKRVPRIYI